MLKRIKAALADSSAIEEPSYEDHKVAAAVMLIEAAALDGDFDPKEREAIAGLLMRHFDIGAADSSDLISMAEVEQSGANDLVRYTRAIKDNYSPENRIELIEMLWEVAYADKVLHEYEANLLRRIGGLLYVSDRDRGEARKRVLNRLGISADG